MTKKMLAAVVAATMVVACAEEEGSTPNPTTDDPQVSSLSTSFKSICATCHGDEGKGKGTFPEIPGNKDEAAFIAIVRAGRGDMPASDASKISDADLKSDYLWLTTKRK